MDRGKLARILGMLGSQHDGEVVAAARAASRLLTDAGISWADLATGVTVVVKAAPPSPEATQAAQEARREPQPRGRQYQRREANPPGKRTRTHRGINAGALTRWLRDNAMGCMTMWERDFTASLLLFSADPALSEKQWARLWEIGVKAGAFQSESAA